MSFWKSLLNITGKAEDSTTRRKQIPDNTFLQARIDSVELKMHEFREYFKVNWIIESEEFKGFRVPQNIKFDVDDNAKSLAALNMVARLFILADKPLPEDKPGIIDWMNLYSHIYIIQVNAGEINGYHKTWVSQVFKDFNDPDLPIQAKESLQVACINYQPQDMKNSEPVYYQQYVPPITETDLKDYNINQKSNISEVLSDAEQAEKIRKTRGVEAIEKIKLEAGLYGSANKPQGEFVDDDIPF